MSLFLTDFRQRTPERLSQVDFYTLSPSGLREAPSLSKIHIEFTYNELILTKMEMRFKIFLQRTEPMPFLKFNYK